MTDRLAHLFQGPLYEQVHQALLSRILSGEWQPSVPLPGEMVLAREFGVSIGTVRKAMDQLARDNVITRERGRGTFVRTNGNLQLGSIFRLETVSGEKPAPRIEVVASSAVVATTAEVEDLRISVVHRKSPSVYRIIRTWYAGDLLLCSECIVVESARFPGLLVELGDGARAETLFDIYERRFRMKVERVEWEFGTLEPRYVTKAAENGLDDESGLLIRRHAFDRRGMPVELCEQWIRLSSCLVQICR